jgi:hypothetical protein
MHHSGSDILDPNVNPLTPEPGSRTVTKYAPHWHWRLNREHYEILDQEAFRRILRWERKRAERSRKFFLLMLIDPRNCSSLITEIECCQKYCQRLLLRSEKRTLLGGISRAVL